MVSSNRFLDSPASWITRWTYSPTVCSLSYYRTPNRIRIQRRLILILVLPRHGGDTRFVMRLCAALKTNIKRGEKINIDRPRTRIEREREREEKGMRGEWQFSIIRSNYNLVYLVKIKNDRRWARQDARFFDCSIFGGKNPPIMQWKAVSIVNRRRKNVETIRQS